MPPPPSPTNGVYTGWCDVVEWEYLRNGADATMEESLHRLDITNDAWALLELHLPGQEGSRAESRRISDDSSMRVRQTEGWPDVEPPAARCCRLI